MRRGRRNREILHALRFWGVLGVLIVECPGTAVPAISSSVMASSPSVGFSLAIMTGEGTNKRFVEGQCLVLKRFITCNALGELCPISNDALTHQPYKASGV